MLAEKPKRVVIIGAGVGGVGTAARLAQAGLDVTVIEKNDFTGGRCSLMHKDGYRFDTGPSLLLLPTLFEQAFADLGTTMEAEGVTLMKCEPNYQIFFHDHEKFTMSTDLPTMNAEISRIEGPEGVNGYMKYLSEGSRHHSISLEHVLVKNFSSYAAMARPEVLQNLLDLHPFESIWSRTKNYFRTERLRRAFTFASMYMGMSPFECPGTFSLLQYTECVEGIWYPKGGFNKVVQALQAISEREGAKYRMSTGIRRIVTEGGKTTGVELENGETVPADVVVCNADAVYAYNHLLPQTSYSKSIAKRPQSCSSVSFYWSLSRAAHELSVHNIFLADKYKESFDDIFHGAGVPEEPSFYVNVPSRIDPTAAPEGKDAVVVLVPIASMKKDGHKNEIDVPALRKHIIATIQSRTGVDLGQLIDDEIIHTPELWREKFNLYAGSILGLSHSFWNVLSFRPRIQHDTFRNLYFVGASVHPGTGVPVCLTGSGITAREVLKDLGYPVDDGKKAKAAGKPLDRLNSLGGTSWILFKWLVMLVLALYLYSYVQQRFL